MSKEPGNRKQSRDDYIKSYYYCLANIRNVKAELDGSFSLVNVRMAPFERLMEENKLLHSNPDMIAIIQTIQTARKIFDTCLAYLSELDPLLESYKGCTIQRFDEKKAAEYQLEIASKLESLGGVYKSYSNTLMSLGELFENASSDNDVADKEPATVPGNDVKIVSNQFGPLRIDVNGKVRCYDKLLPLPDRYQEILTYFVRHPTYHKYEDIHREIYPTRQVFPASIKNLQKYVSAIRNIIKAYTDEVDIIPNKFQGSSGYTLEKKVKRRKKP